MRSTSAFPNRHNETSKRQAPKGACLLRSILAFGNVKYVDIPEQA
jgi:hypothetical protein